ncbi:hypothetical protein SRB5_02000 [Streptomyces sp. RB5]|uniref:OLD protein-like TOPRIM domain-containing protein n=1 Tax=Streptomyces smaragdinus TaxID=2585196 RepID=A0A7K0C9M2_9ACTN|nr:TOPRIM nucleotidyl transferase/hydrolase domain-containing protein [Streptomyces smaragdinus]MQY10096.1 hypothetical protein [Streptomyces smaragdinus]
MVDIRAFRDEVTDRAARGAPGAPARELATALGLRTVVLLEGLSDLAAVDTLAARRGRDLAAEGVCALPMGGATNVGRFARLLGPDGLGLRLVGLCDEREQRFFDRALDDGNVFVCVSDLEEEFIRAMGTERAEEVVERAGELRAWQTLVRQPDQHGRPRDQQLRRFLGTKKGRKIRYGRLLVEGLDPDAVPAPLEDLFAHL